MGYFHVDQMIAIIYKNYFCVDLFGTDKCFFKTQSVIDSVELIPAILTAELNGFPPELIPAISYWTAKTFDTKEYYLKIYFQLDWQQIQSGTKDP